MQITLDIPDRLAQQLQPYHDRLPEILERGLATFPTFDRPLDLDEQTIITLLASRPTPEQILAIRPSSALQDRMSELLAQNKAGSLSPAQEAELERYLTLEHLVRLAKAHAYSLLQADP